MNRISLRRTDEPVDWRLSIAPLVAVLVVVATVMTISALAARTGVELAPAEASAAQPVEQPAEDSSLHTGASHGPYPYP